jgi:hypothetical protein
VMLHVCDYAIPNGALAMGGIRDSACAYIPGTGLHKRDRKCCAIFRRRYRNQSLSSKLWDGNQELGFEGIFPGQDSIQPGPGDFPIALNPRWRNC